MLKGSMTREFGNVRPTWVGLYKKASVHRVARLVCETTAESQSASVGSKGVHDTLSLLSGFQVF